MVDKKVLFGVAGRSLCFYKFNKFKGLLVFGGVELGRRSSVERALFPSYISGLVLFF